jgi:secreted PhoX family phosphatase
MPKKFDRRAFVQRAAKIGGGIYLAPWLQGLAACAKNGDGPAGMTELRDYGPLGASDVSQLMLPANFHAVLLSQSGRPMTSGAPTPNAFDGMAAFALPNGNIRLIRNHEMNDAAATAVAFGDPATAYDSKGPGGTTSLEVRVRPDGAPELVRDFVSLNGTFNNCAGGPTPWGSWLSCEESTQGTTQGRAKPHGYVYEVAVSAEKEVTATPIKPMGRFVHEAVAVDASGIVYLTEDRAVNVAQNIPGSGFYRFLPTTNGNLLAGGKLQALAVQGLPGYNTVTGQTPGTVRPAIWVDIDDPDPIAAETDSSAVCRAGLAKGAAIFQRLEGCWYSPDNNVFFHSTSGGNVGLGQVWKYHPTSASAGELTLVFESPSADALDSPDNITVSPRGGLLICEDGSNGNFLRGLTSKGEIFPFAQNVFNNREFCGGCFSPDGKILFVNIQGGATAGSTEPSFTFAIWGPWEKGAL